MNYCINCIKHYDKYYTGNYFELTDTELINCEICENTSNAVDCLKLNCKQDDKYFYIMFFINKNKYLNIERQYKIKKIL